MNLKGQEKDENSLKNVISLHGTLNAEEVLLRDPLRDLLTEAEVEDSAFEEIELKPRKVVTENLFPDQSIYILEEQLESLRSSINRIKFYLGDVDDLLPS